MQMCTRFQLCQLVLTRVPSRSVLRACDVRRVCIVRRAALLLGKRYNKGRYTSGHKPGTTTALTQHVTFLPSLPSVRLAKEVALLVSGTLSAMSIKLTTQMDWMYKGYGSYSK